MDITVHLSPEEEDVLTERTDAYNARTGEALSPQAFFMHEIHEQYAVDVQRQRQRRNERAQTMAAAFARAPSSTQEDVRALLAPYLTETTSGRPDEGHGR